MSGPVGTPFDERKAYDEHERRESRRLRRAAEARQEALERAIGAIVEVLKGEPTVRRAILFGSAARRGSRPPRDLDIAVEGLDPSRFMAVWLRVEAAAGGVPFDLVDLASAPAALREAVLREGVVLYERT